MILDDLKKQAADKLVIKTDLIQQSPISFQQELTVASACSDFILSSLLQEESLLPWMISHFNDGVRYPDYRLQLQQYLAKCQDEVQLFSLLRKFRRQEMLWIAWQDIHQKLTLKESLLHLSTLAEEIILGAYQWLYASCCHKWGTPINEQGETQPMLILGMGKLGGKELNFSSDIDLIFTYPDNGQTQGARRSLSNAVFFSRLGQRLIKSLDQLTNDGFCYRVDMRLRPFSDSGPLAMSFDALEDYYQEQGREWERYAMIKARVMGQENNAIYRKLHAMLRPFVFRRYIDFSAIESLRRMKAMISTEVRRRGLKNNIKLGAGGIREIEFIAQSFQLIRGGREPSLRHRGIFDTMQSIQDLSLLPKNDVQTLLSAYAYLRRLENILQAIQDKQTQTLPEDTKNQVRLVYAMDADNWQDLISQVKKHMYQVHVIFEKVVGHEEDHCDEQIDHYTELWTMVNRDQEIVLGILHEMHLEQSERIAQELIAFKIDLAKKSIGPRGREIINRLFPLLLNSILEQEEVIPLLSSITNLISQIATRTAYLELLVENPGAIKQLIRLCSASALLSKKLAAYPILLDELLDPNQLYQPTPLAEYSIQLTEFLARIPEEDMEQQMEALRQFKQIQLLRIAAADIAEVLPVMRVSDHLTALAEAILSAVVNQAWWQMKEKFGEPKHLSLAEHHQLNRGFAVIGYGKLGGIELGYNSDLDLVFITDCPDHDMTDGKKSISGYEFYIKLAQRIMHLFSTKTISGILYEIDMRLRPSGASGLLTSTMTSFIEYQQQEAWTWEHQALVRARLVYGEPLLSSDFQRIRTQILEKKRDKEQLKKEVVEMREKMRMHLGSPNKETFYIKQDVGGIADIEFLAQYLVLAYSSTYPSLALYTDNINIFQQAADVGLMSDKQAHLLQQAYTHLRDEIHRLNLLEKKAVVGKEAFLEERRTVINAWQEWMLN